MTTLTSQPLSGLLDRLFEEANTATSPAMGNLSLEECDRLMHSKTEYRHLYGLIRDLWLPVSRETGNLLYMLARSSRARTIVEFGTSFGISTLFLAAALRDNGGGQLITSEFEPSKVVRAGQNLADGGLIDLVEIREGDALTTFADLPDAIDLVLLDGAKSIYLDVFKLIEPRLRPGALIIADDADNCPEYLDYIRSAPRTFLSTSFADDIDVTMRLA
ncbi:MULTISPECIES: class I SAM-dependent methyltransferase [unclassified Ensifer]|uniref:O-methyltransferase n=1 Tax=unclassified Ensifer TaxID=2633371 RepID=UPI00081345C9|nr:MULTISPECIES: class I SAM-dependent methyltransferase [unclassified Ensifer]OCP01716.1 methyltransferase [Ensifer sp. LC14]OCP09504.1 methyltransferase [Ensifer sp. LC13]OCP10677.1 methyltransferase [Ensifer sp. LC11]OCP32753.1 methyltransferase [Ensifer sp. LC499]